MTIASSQSTPMLGNVTQGHAPQSTPAPTALGDLLRLRVKRPPQPVLADPLARHQSIENALSMALWHVRHGTSTEAIQAAAGRAILHRSHQWREGINHGHYCRNNESAPAGIRCC